MRTMIGDTWLYHLPTGDTLVVVMDACDLDNPDCSPEEMSAAGWTWVYRGHIVEA